MMIYCSFCIEKSIFITFTPIFNKKQQYLGIKDLNQKTVANFFSYHWYENTDKKLEKNVKVEGSYYSPKDIYTYWY